MRNFFAFFVIAVAIMFTVACDNGISPVDNTNITDNDVSEPKPFTIRGAVAKGPLVKGSALYFTILSEIGEQEGLILNATTDDDLGRFSYKVTADVSPKVVGKVCKISATGYFYDEIGDRLSNAPVTLEALFRITDTEVQDARINLLTHMTVKRTLELMSDGIMAFEDAQAQAESELIAEMGVFYAPSDEDPKKKAIEMDLTKDPYPLAIACIFGQSAYNIAKDSDEFYGKYQQLLNDTAADLSDGTLTDKTKGIIVAGEQTLDAGACAANLKKYLEEKTGEVQTLPDPNESIDTNKDGVPNVSDPDVDGDGVENELDCIAGKTDFSHLVIMDGGYLCAQKENLNWLCANLGNYEEFDIGQKEEHWKLAFSKVVSGKYHICGLENSKIWCWHDGNIIPTMTQIGDQDWADIFAGDDRLCAVSSTDNFLYCWEKNWQEDITVAPIKTSDSFWKTIYLQHEKIWGIQFDNTLWNWTEEDRIPSLISGDEWLQFSKSSLYGIKNDGTMWYFGENELLPTQVGLDTDWEMLTGTCAIKTDKSTWCWDEISFTPTQKNDWGWSCGKWKEIQKSTGVDWDSTYCGIKFDNSLWCWKEDQITHVE